MIWRPDLAAAAIVRREHRFLIVEERIHDSLVLNQPAGHVDDGESIVDAAVRETLEETAWHFVPRALLGLYLWRNPQNGHSILRAAIIGDVTHHEAARRLDEPVVAAHWMTREGLLGEAARLRSPLVMRCIDDYLAGVRHDLSALNYLTAQPVAATA
ncbi:MAG TPA: NUDIX hydrolase [Steroidobacteraceae bacterium]|nr:NUDIX hydrolase [Steroidobacteraceae bacterium]